MEEKVEETAVTWEETLDGSDQDAYVSPEVAAAERGEQVEMGKDLGADAQVDDSNDE